MTSKTTGGWDFGASGASGPGALGATPPVEPPGGTGFGTGSAPSGDGRPRGHGAGDAVRTVVRGIGQLLITLGLVLLLFVVYEVWVSNIYAHQRQDKVKNNYQAAVAKGQDPLKGQDRLNLPSGKQVVLPAGQGFANLYIPTFGKDFAWTIVEGTNDADLERGPGHYPGTAIPGQIGNFSVAGHRVGKGEPFLNLDQLNPGDDIVVQTAANWYVYQVLGDKSLLKSKGQAVALGTADSQGVVGREIVSPSQVSVIDKVPDHPDASPSRALLTLTTCHPKYTANQRLIIHAALVRSVPAKGSATPKEMAGGTL
ncbi:class E sortase [Jatrophihabitans telluris]|uniref:Class E sortase n=1 Tax=Jatrophihabitans telluris TaxID=2038343 RepID=A0ABY4R095_9ACTN|nr:class E sortase [Jatrophihabitans telluris]UQX88575.1 class E sortase [Jatrophihabitans telluris]